MNGFISLVIIFGGTALLIFCFIAVNTWTPNAIGNKELRKKVADGPLTRRSLKVGKLIVGFILAAIAVGIFVGVVMIVARWVSNL